MEGDNSQVLFQVRLHKYGPVVYARAKDGVEILTSDRVVLETEKGQDWGTVVSSLFLEREVTPEYVIIRKFSEEDEEKMAQLFQKIPEVLRIVRDKVLYHSMDMNVIAAEYTFDASKLIIYFVAEDRVDFRQLVRDLARTFRSRIEMRQVGVRDGAKMVGGLGICGREICCKSFLREFKSMSIKMAKDQNLSLNPTKISGICGRLMCCLGYEWEVYKEVSKDLPRVGQYVSKGEYEGRVVEVNILRRKIKLEVEAEEARQYVWVDWQELVDKV